MLMKRVEKTAKNIRIVKIGKNILLAHLKSNGGQASDIK